MPDDPAAGTLNYGSFPARVLLPPGTYDPSKETVNAVGIVSSLAGGLTPSERPLFALQTSSAPTVTVAAGNVAFFGSAGVGADQIANLPAATGSGFIKIFSKEDANLHYIVLTALLGDLINGLPTYSLGNIVDGGQYDGAAIIDKALGVWRLIWGFVP